MVSMSMKRKIRNLIIIAIIGFSAMIIRIAYIQFIEGNKLIEEANSQQTSDRNINPKRGTIYDATGKNVLAASSTVQTITVNPTNIKEKEKVAKELSDLFSLDYNTVLNRLCRKTSIESIAKKVDNDKANELRKWMSENNITQGINIDEDTKRFYPYNDLASQLIGVCGGDNQGLNGIEKTYEEYLKGKKGNISKVVDASGKKINGTSEEYTKPTDGDDIVLSMDLNIQGIAEKYLKQACIDNECTDGGNVVIMSPKTGDILALVGYPDYNLNDPFAADESLSKDEQTKQVQALWRNKAISDTYEPGSTFKLVTTSAALEEGITTPDKEGEFCCVGYIDVAGVKMKCWRYYKPHGPESLREALMNSCNPIFIGLGEKLGVHTYYKYLNNFGFFRQTGIDLPGEAKGIFLKEEKVGPVELGTIAFGQRFEITPIQMATMLSTIANKGVYIKPRVVKEIIKKSESTNEESENENNSNKESKNENNSSAESKSGNNSNDSNKENNNDNNSSEENKNNEVLEKVEEVPIEQGERVISEKTSSEILSMMQTVVDQGTGKNAKVEGYSIGGKTGTSEDGVNTGKYITSFIGVAPIEDPQIVVLLTLYNPKGEGGHSGGGIAAPVAGKIFKEVLEYLDVKKNN